MYESGISITPLGAGSEVGRSCIHIKYRNTQLLFDIGVHPAFTGISSLPFLDLIDLSRIDAIFVTHFHLDHAGALPFLTEKTAFAGRIYMTHPTFHILRYLLNDFTRLINASSPIEFYNEEDLDKCYTKIIPIDYHQEVFVKDVCVVALNAGHVLGAAMFKVKNRGYKLLYTGDYSREEDRHLRSAEFPGKIDSLIVESTYGVQCHLPRHEREERFTSTIKNIVMRGGKVLLPVFALGRAQELLLILEEFWQKTPELKNVPIYYASALAKRCIGIYQTYSSASKSVNFNFKFISSINTYEDSELPCVVMASPGMLQSGLSRELFEKWCEDPRNGVLIAGYCVNGTLAKDIMNEPDEVETLRGERLKLRCSVDYISFSAHVDFIQNSQFIAECNPEHVFLVHGEVNEMNRLKNALKRENIHCLRNGESFDIKIVTDRVIRIRNYKEGIQSCILKGKDDIIDVLDLENETESQFKQKAFINLPESFFKELQKRCDVGSGQKELLLVKNIPEPEIKKVPKKPGRKPKLTPKSKKPALETTEIAEPDTPLSTHSINESLPQNAKIILIKNVLYDYFDEIQCENDKIIISGISITISDQKVNMEWEGSYVKDLLASTIVRLIKNIGKNIESVKISRLDEKESLVKILKNYYENVCIENGVICVKERENVVTIVDQAVSGDEVLASKVKDIADNFYMIFANKI